MAKFNIFHQVSQSSKREIEPEVYVEFLSTDVTEQKEGDEFGPVDNNSNEVKDLREREKRGALAIMTKKRLGLHYCNKYCIRH